MGQHSARHDCFIAVTGSIMRGRGWDGKNAQSRQQCNKENDGKLGPRGGKGSSDACPLGDAAQSVTHLDVLACVVAS